MSKFSEFINVYENSDIEIKDFGEQREREERVLIKSIEEDEYAKEITDNIIKVIDLFE